MKTKITIIFLLAGITFSAKAQTVTIPDANFVTYLQANFPTCMTGNQMDTACINSTTDTSVYVSGLNISDLTGIQYFRNLHTLNCINNNLTSIPALTTTYLQALFCDSNNLTSIPPILSSNLYYLTCSYNQLTSLPVLPQYLYSLDASHNNIQCFPSFPNSIQNIIISSNPNTCVPNHISTMDAPTLALPICVFGDTVNNPHGCAPFEEITGWTYKDNNGNCIYDAGDDGMGNINVKLYDNTSAYISQTYSYANGMYSFVVPGGTYTVKLDTAGTPYHNSCAHPGVDTTVTFSSITQNVNFSVACNGFDVGVQYVFPEGDVFPGMTHAVNIYAGDMSQWYGFDCASGVGGTVQVTFTGPVTYVGPYYWGSLTPTVAGNVLTYTVVDFGSIYSWSDFGILLHTDTTATTGDQVCINVVVTPSVSGDLNPSNNTYNFCYDVFNSYDPNSKQVYPETVPPLYNDYLTYSIHFQNTGSAAAQNIKVIDTLSSLLDVTTFKEINHNHANVVSFNGNIITFNFPNINLIDSTVNDTTSIGWIQYKIKPISGLPSGTHINNKASIYFDYNAPVVTNTAITVFGTTGINKLQAANSTLQVYPNPSNGKYFAKLSDGTDVSKLSIEVTNLLGEIIVNTKTQNILSQIDLSSEPAGIYFVRVIGGTQAMNQRVVKE